MDRYLSAAMVILLLCIVSSIDTNRYIRSHYPDDQKLNQLKAPLAGLVIVMDLLILASFR